MLTDEMRFKLMRELDANPNMSQRALAKVLGVSLGKLNFCLQALVGKGLVKVRNFRKSENKAAYMYMLTPRGIELKASLAVQYLKNKLTEYEELQVEIVQLKEEVSRGRLESRVSEPNG